MGLADRIPESRFSSEGCQVVAGTVRKGEPDSERGPWRKFIEPFLSGGSAPPHGEYVLFSGHELQQMAVGRYRGKTVILRFGSRGPLVEGLQRKLGIAIDGDFGPRTFRAVLDYQTRKFGPDADDGIVGAETAGALGLTLPTFDFERAVTLNAATDAVATPSRSTRLSNPEPIAWGAVTERKHGPAFKEKVVAIAERLGCDPSHLMAVMAFESGESFAPDKRNAAGSGATGLIQFMRNTARELKTTTAQLAAMTALQQLEFVEKHFRSVAGNRPLRTLGDVYMAVLWPAAIGRSESHALFREPARAYEQNKGLDAPPKDGVITKAEATAKVFAKLQKGMQAGRIG